MNLFSTPQPLDTPTTSNYAKPTLTFPGILQGIKNAFTGNNGYNTASQTYQQGIGISSNIPNNNLFNPQNNYSKAPNYSPAPIASNTSATGTSATSAIKSPAAQQYIQSKVNDTSTPTVQNGIYSASTGLTANGLNPNQVAQGYSTIPGNFNPLTGQPNSGSTLSNTPSPLPTTSSANTQQVDSNGNPIGAGATATDANSAFQKYLTSLQGDQSALATFNNQEKTTQAQLGAQPILSSFATGQQAVQQAAAQGEQANLEQNVTNDQTGIANIQGEQQIGVQQQQNANTLALGLKPVVAQYGQTVFNPATGQYSNGGNVQLSGQPATDTTSLATAVANGSIDYNTAFTQLSNAYGGAVANQLLGTIQKSDPSFNVNSSIGAGAAAQSNASTTGSVSTTANATGYTNALQTYNTLNTAANAASQQSDSVSSILAQSGLNNSSSNDYTTALNNLSGRLGNTNVTALDTAIAELQNRYSTLLASNGTTPSGAQTQALQLLNPNSSAAQINQAINVLKNSAGILVGNQYQQLQGYQQQLNSAGTTKSSSTSGFGWNG